MDCVRALLITSSGLCPCKLGSLNQRVGYLGDKILLGGMGSGIGIVDKSYHGRSQRSKKWST